ncbi:hypothetical protein ACFV2U_30350 [Streptomyces sp. NPDC059697]|uniref:hypothetical protein n=1 Tax=Streptomyces sp. NPDC059697 TaxID=3346912 RepID=UPI00367C7E56
MSVPVTPVRRPVGDPPGQVLSSPAPAPAAAVLGFFVITLDALVVNVAPALDPMRLVPRGGADAWSDFGDHPAAGHLINFTPHWRTGAYRPRIRRHFGDRTARADHRRAP